MSKIFVIGVDGLHNNGKTTQLGLLKENLEQRGSFTLIRRGDGSRKGFGEDEFDPVSGWWQENRPRILTTGFEGKASHDAAAEASNRLNRELYLIKNWWMPRELKKRGQETGVILLDRGLISRLFVYRRYRPQAEFEDVKYFSTRGKQREAVIPNIIFLLHAPLGILMARNVERQGEDSKQAFNETILKSYYDDFAQYIGRLPEEIRSRTIVIDSSKTIPEIQQELLENTLRIIAEREFRIEGNSVLRKERK